MEFTLAAILFAFIAWCSGEHHARRAKDMIRKYRVERSRKWRKLRTLVHNLKRDNHELREILRRTKK